VQIVDLIIYICLLPYLQQPATTPYPEFYVHGIVHRNSMSINNCPTRCNYTQFILSVNWSTCFVWFLHLSSGTKLYLQHLVLVNRCCYPSLSRQVAIGSNNVWPVPDAVDSCVPDDGWTNYTKHAEQIGVYYLSLCCVVCWLTALAGWSPWITESLVCRCWRWWDFHGSFRAQSCLMTSHIHFIRALFVCIAE